MSGHAPKALKVKRRGGRAYPALVLGRGELMVVDGPSRSRTALYLWDREHQKRVRLAEGRMESGTLLWLPDARKP